ncbi:protein rogdi [Octopus bimaculoides]|uniref:Protein rogdi homolog n=2 Tax=Octopus TaxID=6643 RepID=A0A0L8FTL3_OCTBM|nr:protein rogdi [Octopus bimaculoides]XP_029637536.1 protein rogdi isoform X1 [Octopus sinensis]|eukprot:XP_014787239.1 PREDICTED: protein rogdi-like [Octopus bimaculoides]
MAGADIEEEICALQKELSWLLNEELHHVLQQVQYTLTECNQRFLTDKDKESNKDDSTVCHIKPQKILLSGPNGTAHIKCVLTLFGDNITEADINFKHKQGNHHSLFKTSIHQSLPWKLQQIQDAYNHLKSAAYCISLKENYAFKSVREVTLFIDEVMESIKKGRTCLTFPRRKSVEELLNNQNMQVFHPAVPNTVALSFYIHTSKLILALYQIHRNNQKIEVLSRHQVECTVKWLNEAIMLFTLAIQQLQQLKDKIQSLQYFEETSHFINVKS